MKADINIQQLSKTISHFLHRYHVILFVLSVIGGLALATFMINQSINERSADQPATGIEKFDATTIEKINKLNPSSTQSTPFTLPSGRTNPFM